jgi:hypothetical protein
MTWRLNQCCVFLGLFLLGGSATSIGAMQLQDQNLCDIAARRAAQIYGVPVEILLSIARVETGRGDALAAWPWTANADGQGYWFDTHDQAIDFAETQLALGNGDFDVGCFQINLKWHPEAFESLEDAFDPIHNAIYAAQFLVELFQVEGDWKSAVTAYHSRTPDKAEAYVKRVEAAYSDLISAPDLLLPANADASVGQKDNRFPLIRRGEYAGFGSLVPRRNADRALIGATP